MLFYKKKYGYLIFRIIVFVFFGGGVGTAKYMQICSNLEIGSYRMSERGHS